MTIESHLARCPECRSEDQKFLAVISAARAATPSELRLSPSVRQRIALEAASGAARRPWTAWLPQPGYRLRYGAVAAAFVCLIGILFAPTLRLRLQAPPSGADVTRIEVVADRGVVRLAWSDGQRASYTVMKSDDPRSLAGGEVHVVRGNVWVDRQPDSSAVVFYRIE